MKLCKRLIPCLLVLTILLCSLTSCIEGKTAKETIRGFLSAVKAEDFEKAASFLHPEIATDTDLKEYFESVEKNAQVDFQSAMEIVRYTGFESSFYDSNVDGSLYKTSAILKISEKQVYINVEIVENDAGFGIYYFGVDY